MKKQNKQKYTKSKNLYQYIAILTLFGIGYKYVIHTRVNDPVPYIFHDTKTIEQILLRCFFFFLMRSCNPNYRIKTRLTKTQKKNRFILHLLLSMDAVYLMHHVEFNKVME